MLYNGMVITQENAEEVAHNLNELFRGKLCIYSNYLRPEKKDKITFGKPRQIAVRYTSLGSFGNIEFSFDSGVPVNVSIDVGRPTVLWINDKATFIQIDYEYYSYYSLDIEVLPTK